MKYFLKYFASLLFRTLISSFDSSSESFNSPEFFFLSWNFFPPTVVKSIFDLFLFDPDFYLITSCIGTST